MIFVAISFLVIGVTVAVLWLRSMRPIDRMSLISKIGSRTKTVRFIYRRSTMCEISLSNGFKTLVAGADRRLVIEEVLKLKMRPDDVIVATYPKAGTTWMQEIVWLICNNVDVTAAKAINVNRRYGYLECPNLEYLGCGLQALENWPKNKTRFIKTHLRFECLPLEIQKTPIGKMIYVVRNPKDNCVSYFHFARMTFDLPEPGTWSDFLTSFSSGHVPRGSWFDHVHKYWQIYQERKSTIHFVSYESLKKDIKAEIAKLAKFLGKDISQQQIYAIAEHCSFESMSKNDKTNHCAAAKEGMFNFKISKFMRKGEVGDWKNHFTINENKAFDAMFQRRTKDWTLKFAFEPAN